MPRYHLSYDYQHRDRAWRNSGDQVMVADNLEQAVRRIARECDVSLIHIRKRFFTGQPASTAEIIDRDFDFSGVG